MKRLIVPILAVFLVPSVSLAASSPGKKFTSPPATLEFDRKKYPSIPDSEVVATRICSGSVRMEMPKLGRCPRIPGYYAVGIPVCTQPYDVPKRWKLIPSPDGDRFRRFGIQCVLDYDNMTEAGPISCDYSKCTYISEPKFPWPGGLKEEIDVNRPGK